MLQQLPATPFFNQPEPCDGSTESTHFAATSISRSSSWHFVTSRRYSSAALLFGCPSASFARRQAASRKFCFKRRIAANSSMLHLAASVAHPTPISPDYRSGSRLNGNPRKLDELISKSA